MMKVLAIDSSGLTATVALVDENVTIACYTMNYKKTHSVTLLPMIDEILKMTETKLEEVDGIVVAGGPGSFTGLRIGTATAKGFGLAFNKPLINIPTVDGLAYQIYGFEGLICPIMDARRNQVYTGLYTFEKGGDDLSSRVAKDQLADDLSFRVVKEQSALSIDDVIKDLNNRKEHVMFLGDGVLVHQEQLKREIEVPLFFAPAFLNRQNAAALGSLGIRYLKEGKTKTALEYKPEYLRVAQAERERLELVESSKVEIGRTESEDITTILELERQNFTDPWSIANITETLNQPYNLCLTAKSAGKVVGYLFASMIEDGEILAISVSEEMKRQGIGKALLEELMRVSMEKGISRLILDVRKSNTSAICFYERMGFVEDGIRKGYYSNPNEDGVLMSLKMY
jgi:tRNA threonylcarbamoyl adenosine modification protein YeaZ/ribosomal-protein-alanine acetyltransferase